AQRAGSEVQLVRAATYGLYQHRTNNRRKTGHLAFKLDGVVQARTVTVGGKLHAPEVITQRAATGDAILDQAVFLEGGNGFLEGRTRANAQLAYRADTIAIMVAVTQ